MTEIGQAVAADGARGHRDEPALEVGGGDVLLALFTFAVSLAVLGYGLSAIATVPIFVLLHLAVLVVPAVFVRMRARGNADLTIPVLLLVATFAAGPVGALGCAILAAALWCRRPSPHRMQHWYDYIAGVVARSRTTRIHDELMSGRLPRDPAAKVPRFGPILQDASIAEQQRVLGVIGRRYHADFRPALRKAMRNSNGFIRAQAAAVASRLSADEKNRLWSTASAREDEPDQAADRDAKATMPSPAAVAPRQR